MTTGTLETLVMVTVCCAEVVPTGTLPKSKAVGEIRNVLSADASADPLAAARTLIIVKPVSTTESRLRHVARPLMSGLSISCSPLVACAERGDSIRDTRGRDCDPIRDRNVGGQCCNITAATVP